jgi:putative DNA primase/helicase
MTASEPAHPFTYSRGRDKFDNCPEPRSVVTFNAFCDAVLSDRAKAKGEQYIAAPFSSGSHPTDPDKFPGEKGWRVGQYAEPRCWIPMDLDGCSSAEAFEALRKACNGVSCFIYTTGSHTSASPRARLIFELTRPVDREEGIKLGKALGAGITKHLSEHAFDFDANVYRGEQPIYLPLQDAETFVFNGQPLDADKFLQAYQGATTATVGSDDFELVEIESDKTDEVVKAKVTGSSKYKNLWEGRWSNYYPSQSEADFTLLWRLCEVTPSNDQVRRLFWKSGLGQRDKAQRKNYVDPMLKQFRAEQAELNKVDLEKLKAGFPGMRPSFESMLAQTDSLAELTKVDQVEAVEKLVADAAHLSQTKKDAIYKAIKKNADVGLGVLRAQERDNREKREPEPDDGTLAKQLVAEIGEKNTLAAESYVWLWENTGVWRPLADREVKQQVQRFISDKIKSVTKYRVDSVRDLFTSEVFRPEHQFNVGPPECVNVLNGELVLEANEWRLHPHVREHYRTTQIPVEWDPEAKAPRFLQFLKEIFEGDPDAGEKAWALLEMMGYTLMTHCSHERFIMLVGNGANGKSVFLYVLERLCGRKNVTGVQPSEFRNSFKRAHLHGKLANIVSELPQGKLIDDEALKSITSGELTTVDRKHKHPFDMRPYSTCWFGTNHLPHTRDFSDALFRRALVVPFNRQFKPEQGNCDPMLKDKLVGELPGILWMALNAYKRALVRGFTMPASCIEAGKKWRLEADQVAQFVKDCCVVDPDGSEPAFLLYGVYGMWADRCGIRNKVGIKQFRDRLTLLGFGDKRIAAGKLVTGLKLTREEEQRVRPSGM